MQRTRFLGSPRLENPVLASMFTGLCWELLLVVAIGWCSQASLPMGVASLGLWAADPIIGHSTQWVTGVDHGGLEDVYNVSHAEGRGASLRLLFQESTYSLKCAYVSAFFLMFLS